MGAWLTLSSCASQTEPGTAEEIVQRAVEKYQDTILKAPYASPASFMEKAMCSEEYCMYTEAVGYFYSLGYNYEIEAGNFVFLPENLKKSDRKTSWLETLNNWYADAPHIKHQTDLWPGIGSLFSSFRWFEIKGPLGDPGSFTYEITDTLESQSPEATLIQIEFEPAGGREDKGTLTIDSETFSIHRIKLEQTRFYSQNFRQWVSSKGEVTYHPEDSHNSIASVHYNYEKNSLEYSIIFQTSSLVKHYNNVDEVESRAMWVNTKNPFVYYQPDIWPSVSPFSGLHMDSVRRDLEEERTLEEQFVDNAGQPYFTRIYQDGRELTVHGGEETYEIIRQVLDRLELEFKNEKK